MATEKLYYEDPYIRNFHAQLVENGVDENGRHYVVLDKTAFYATGGGQPNDTGMINNVPVYDVEEVDGEIRHFIQTPIEEKECSGEIDWERRFDHMQQHAGQHILSAAFEEMYGYKTVSFHLGEETCSIDLEVQALGVEEASRVEERANAILLENRPIEVKWVTTEEASRLPLRKALSVTDNIRLVIIPEFDYNGCGGTHPSTTGQVSTINILHWEKQKKNYLRIYFVCGNRARKQLHEKHRVIQQLTGLLNAPQEKLADAAIRILDEQKDLKKEMGALKFTLLEEEANRLAEQAEEKKHYRFVEKIFTDKPMGELQQLAKNVTEKTSRGVVLFMSHKDDRLQFVCARSKDIDIRINEVVKALLPVINGKGGGSPMIAQGGGDPLLSPEAFAEKLVEAIENVLAETV